MARAIRPFFLATPNHEGKCLFRKEEVEFEWQKGMSWQVRQRSSISMAEEIARRYPELDGEILEVSTKSVDYELGKALSAFNLTIEDAESGHRYPIENWFQSSKFFEGATLLNQNEVFGPYEELLYVEPLQAKRFLNTHLPDDTKCQYAGNPLFERIQAELTEARFAGFSRKGTRFPTEPKSAFYDCLYIRALMQDHNSDLAKSLLRFSAFTDIEFNSTKKTPRYNTQARSCAIFVALSQAGLLNQAMSSIGLFIETVGYSS